jgi:hypothetical protein
MVASVGGGTGADQPASRSVRDQALDLLAHARHLGCDLLPQRVVIAEVLRRHALYQPPSLLHQRVQLGIAADVELLEARRRR